jgi:hypothetical protein
MDQSTQDPGALAGIIEFPAIPFALDSAVA